MFSNTGPGEVPGIVTAGGWARSGKGTSMTALRERLEDLGKTVEHIDQGLKFRAMGLVAVNADDPLDSPATLGDFIGSPKAQEAILELLGRVAQMNDAERRDLLYKPDISRAAGRVGQVPSAHEVAVGLLRAQVEAAAEAKVDVIIIDGRAIEKYAQEFDDRRLARLAIGWYFKCDPVIAARRSLGLFGAIDGMNTDDKLRLLEEMLSISDRNRSDMLRDVDPMHELPSAYTLDLAAYASPDRGITPHRISYDIIRRRGSQAVVDTSYTNRVDDMTAPVVELSMYALSHRGILSGADLVIARAS